MFPLEAGPSAHVRLPRASRPLVLSGTTVGAGGGGGGGSSPRRHPSRLRARVAEISLGWAPASIDHGSGEPRHPGHLPAGARH